MGLLSKNRLNGKADKNCGFERSGQLIGSGLMFNKLDQQSKRGSAYGNENIDILQKGVACKSNIDDIKPTLAGDKKRPAPGGMEHQVSKRQKPAPHCNLVNTSISFEDKQRLKSQLLEILMEKVPSDIRGCLQKYGLLSQNQDRINTRIDALDNKGFGELKGFISTCCKEGDQEVKASDDKPHLRLVAPPKCDSCGCVSCYCSRIHSSNEASCVGEALYSNVKQSPGKADRAAMLKQRFAGIILKAQHKTLFDHSGNADHHKKLEVKQLSEKKWHGGDAGEPTINLEAKYNAAKNIMRKRARAAARHALEEVERTLDFCDNLKVLKDLEMLSGCTVGYSWSGAAFGAFEGGHHVRPLERIGLFIKDEYWGDDDTVEDTYGEEGEILD